MHWWTSGGESAAVKVFADAVHRGRRHLGRHRDRRRRRTRARPASTASSAATRPRRCSSTPASSSTSWSTRRPAARRRRRGHGRQLATRSCRAAIVDAVDPQRQVLRHAGQHPRHRLALVQQEGVRQGRHRRRAQDLAPRCCAAGEKLKAAGPRSASPTAASPGRSSSLFNSVLVGAGRHRPVLQDLPRQGPRCREGAGVHARSPSSSSSCTTYVDPGSPAATGTTPPRMVITGKAGMQVMGDWAKGEFTAAGLTAGKEYGCAVVGRGRLPDGRRRVRLPQDRRPGRQQASKLASVLLEPGDPDRLQQEEGLGPGPARRRRVEHGRLRPDGRGGAARTRSAQVPTTDFLISPDLVGRARRRHHPVLEQRRR